MVGGAVVAVPIVIREDVYGVLAVLYDSRHDFTDLGIQLLQTLADSAAVAIGNARFIEQTQRARQEVEDANEELDAFNYSVSHDLRAPLRSIDGFSQALLEDYADQFR